MLTYPPNPPPPMPLQSLHTAPSFWTRQFRIEIPRHQQFVSPGALSECYNDNIYSRGVVGGEVTSDDVQWPLPRFQLKGDNIWSKLLNGLYRKLWGRPVEYRHSDAVSAQRVRSDDAVSVQPPSVDSVGDTGFLGDSQV